MRYTFGVGVSVWLVVVGGSLRVLPSGYNDCLRDLSMVVTNPTRFGWEGGDRSP